MKLLFEGLFSREFCKTLEKINSVERVRRGISHGRKFNLTGIRAWREKRNGFKAVKEVGEWKAFLELCQKSKTEIFLNKVNG